MVYVNNGEVLSTWWQHHTCCWYSPCFKPRALFRWWLMMAPSADILALADLAAVPQGAAALLSPAIPQQQLLGGRAILQRVNWRKMSNYKNFRQPYNTTFLRWGQQVTRFCFESGFVWSSKDVHEYVETQDPLWSRCCTDCHQICAALSQWERAYRTVQQIHPSWSHTRECANS